MRVYIYECIHSKKLFFRFSCDEDVNANTIGSGKHVKCDEDVNANTIGSGKHVKNRKKHLSERSDSNMVRTQPPTRSLSCDEKKQLERMEKDALDAYNKRRYEESMAIDCVCTTTYIRVYTSIYL